MAREAPFFVQLARLIFSGWKQHAIDHMDHSVGRALVGPGHKRFFYRDEVGRSCQRYVRAIDRFDIARLHFGGDRFGRHDAQPASEIASRPSR